MRLLLILVTTVLSTTSWGQVSTCDGTRYASFAYTPSSTTAIQYGNATTYAGNNQDLYLDFYEPAGDAATERPLIILAFGGSFISGVREDMDWMCEYYTSLGYTAATIDYRLYDGPIIPFPDSVAMTEEVLMAVSDMKAAVRFFKEDAATNNTYRIDTNHIFLGGISAGAITAAHTALLDSNDVVESYIQPLLANNGGWTGNSSTNTQYTDNVRGLLNFSGALRKASYIDANDPEFFSVHDAGDDVVPYATGSASIIGVPIISMQGSYEMDQQAQSVGVNSELITFPGTGHVSYFQGSNQLADSVLWESALFLYDIVCPQFAGFESNEELSGFIVYPNPTMEGVTVEWDDENVQSVQILNAMGQVLEKYTPNGQSQSIDLGAMASGMYFVRATSQNGSSIRSIQKM